MTKTDSTTVWKIAPGQNADHWEMCFNRGCILIGWAGLEDFRAYSSVEQIVEALGPGPKGGLRLGAAKSIWRFVRKVKAGHVVVANKGLSRVVGIGVVRSKYLPPESTDNPSESEDLASARLVDWLIPVSVRLGKRFFADQTVWPLSTEQCEEIRLVYARKHPKLAKRVAVLLDGGANDEDYPESDSNTATEFDIEGTKSEFRSLKSKRSRWLRDRAFEAANGVCAVCKRDFSQLLTRRGTRVLEVHHLKQLSSHDAPVVTKLTDLAVVCANCHLLLHLNPKKPLRIDELRKLLKGKDYLFG